MSLSAPCVQKTRRDPVSPRNHSPRGSRARQFRDNRQLLIDAPPAPPLRSRQNLRPWPRSRHKSARKSGLADRKNDRLTSSTSRRCPSEDYETATPARFPGSLQSLWRGVRLRLSQAKSLPRRRPRCARPPNPRQNDNSYGGVGALDDLDRPPAEFVEGGGELGAAVAAAGESLPSRRRGTWRSQG